MPLLACAPAPPAAASAQAHGLRVHRNDVEWATQPSWPEHDPDLPLLDSRDVGPTARTRSSSSPVGSPAKSSLYRAPIEPWPSTEQSEDQLVAPVTMVGVDPDETVSRFPVRRYVALLERGWAS